VAQYVVDSCVALKWLLPEPEHEIAERLLSPAYSLHAPDFLLAEITNVLWSNVRRGIIREAVALKAVRDVPSYFQGYDAARELIVPGFDLAMEIDHSPYDCIYLALAIEAGMPLITADAKLVRKLAGTPYEGRAVLLADWS
jgi:predicted nucleic acid-binding protein